MPKNRHTFAKWHRDLEKKRKAQQKRDRRAKKRLKAGDVGELNASPSSLSIAEHAVLRAFREHAMIPGKVHCFRGSELAALRVPLTQLSDKGLLVEEESPGGYSLTDMGFAAMKRAS